MTSASRGFGWLRARGPSVRCRACAPSATCGPRTGARIGWGRPSGIGLGLAGPRGGQKLHYPDLILETSGGKRVAVELELTPKSAPGWSGSCSPTPPTPGSTRFCTWSRPRRCSRRWPGPLAAPGWRSWFTSSGWPTAHRTGRPTLVGPRPGPRPGLGPPGPLRPRADPPPGRSRLNRRGDAGEQTPTPVALAQVAGARLSGAAGAALSVAGRVPHRHRRRSDRAPSPAAPSGRLGGAERPRPQRG